MADAGSDTPDAGPIAAPPDGGTADAGAPDAGTIGGGLPDAGATDAGTADAGAADAGLPPDCLLDAGFDARCLDAGTASITVTPSGAARCQALLPIRVPQPLGFTKTIGQFGGGIWSCGALADGDGNLGVCIEHEPDSPADGRHTEVLATDDGRTLVSLGGGPVRSQTHGLVAESMAVDYGQSTILSGWGHGDGGTVVLDTIIPDPRFERPTCRFAEGPDQDITLGCSAPDAGPTLQQLDFALRPLGAPAATSEALTPLAIDEQQKMLAYLPDGSARWFSRAGAALSGPVQQPLQAPRALVGGGLDVQAGELSSGGTALTPRPDWITQRPDALTLVRGRSAYAYARPATGCTQTLELLASDGTVCATIEVTEPNCDPRYPPSLTMGAEGTLSDEASRYCRDGACAIAWRVWPHLLQ